MGIMTQFSMRSTVTRVAFEYGVELLLQSDTVIRLEAMLDLPGRQGETTRVDSEALGPAALEVLTLLHREVTVEVRDDGNLRIATEDGWQLEAVPSSDFEAWTVTNADGSRLVSLPGGEIATWS